MADRPASDASEAYGTPAHTPLQLDDVSPLPAPTPSYLNPGPSLSSTPRDSYGTANDYGTPTNSTPFLAQQVASPQTNSPSSSHEAITEKPTYDQRARTPVYKTPGDGGASAASASSSASASTPSSPAGATSGGDGSRITMDNGQQFVYRNAFGGNWVYNPKDPFNNGARPNSWTPPLNTSWTWGKDQVYGVNLGGLFVLEPFISPSLFQKYPGTVDEWTLSEAMAADTAGGGLQGQLEDHYNTFITEQDLAQIAGAGLNWIRVPIPFWAIETWEGEPFLAKVCWKYMLRLIGWARKYGLRIYLDLHTVPGSQNGYNHSGRLGQINFMNGIMGLANAQRTLDYIRIITEFISQPEYRDVVVAFGIVNEALVNTIGQDQMTSFYLQAHNMIRSITGTGAGNGPYITVHDGFIGVSNWAGFLPGSDRIILDTHPYFAFSGQANNAPLIPDDGLGEPGGVWPKQACSSWGGSINASQSAFGVTIAGEYSNAINDCGTYVNGVGNGPKFAGDCTPFINWQSWNATFKQGLLDFATASMDATQNCRGRRAARARARSQRARPRRAVAARDAVEPRRRGDGRAADVHAHEHDLDAAPAHVQPDATVSVPDGWFDAKDTAGAMTEVQGCSYPNAWDSKGVVAPTAACGAGGGAGAATAAAAAGAVTAGP
ncbi:hypothetical protein EVG20_g8595 [Dentipellis fragilis]|uniref:glucan 1,3-beta-glucosidase n=1 Tax=Dentipellis fragilis TaxID=205917 RepID=A0A4Y9Y7A3_9AGAM|nr:hypothetical protein EVG20_g8595 [Dentipellis fragilis]